MLTNESTVQESKIGIKLSNVVENTYEPRESSLRPGLEPTVRSQKEEVPRTERKMQYGIDCADLVHFSHWFRNYNIGSLVENM